VRKKKHSLVVLENINFLDNPTYVLDLKTTKKEHPIYLPNGKFAMASSMALPTYFDRKVLNCILTHIINIDGDVVDHEVKTTRYAIASMLYKRKIKDSYTFDRIFEALLKYKSVTFFFDGIFYGDNYESTQAFSYIDTVKFNKQTKEIYIRFNEEYITLIKESGYAKHIDFVVYNSFNLPISSRLYEILCKLLVYNTSWSIGIQSLAEKLPLQKRPNAKDYYASDVLAKINPGISEINKKSPLKVEISYNKGSNVITFKRIKKSQTIKKNIFARKNQSTFTPAIKDSALQKSAVKLTKSTCLKKFKALSGNEQQTILNAINKNRYLDILPDIETKIFAHMKAQQDV
jgi:hypothetical protein